MSKTRKTIILFLSALVLITSSCKQTEKEQTETANNAVNQTEFTEKATENSAVYTQLITAIEADDRTSFDKLIKQIIDKIFFIQKENEYYSYTLLGYACKYKRCDLAKKLIDLGADIEIGGSDDYLVNDALSVAVWNEDLCLVKLLLEKGANPNRMNSEEGVTVLSLASGLANFDIAYDIAKLLIEKGAIVDGLGYTEGIDYVHYPLLHAVESNNIKLVQLLIDHNCKIDIRDRQGEAPFSIAKRNENQQMHNLLKEYSYIHAAEDFLKQLMNGEKIQSSFSNNWTFIYHEDNRCDGSTDGEKTDLSPFEIDEIIQLKVKNDGNGWACEKKEPTEFYLDFKLKEKVKNWDRFEMPNDEANQGKDGIIHVVGKGESDYLVLYYDSNSLIIKMEYRSEDPG